jgi:hypothetical protein
MVFRKPTHIALISIRVDAINNDIIKEACLFIIKQAAQQMQAGSKNPTLQIETMS